MRIVQRSPPGDLRLVEVGVAIAAMMSAAVVFAEVRDLQAMTMRPGLGLSLIHIFVGFCRIGREKDNGELLGEIVALYLLPQFQRQGIGKRLMQTGIDQLRQRGYSTIVLWVLKSNVQARQFYEHCGFTAEPAPLTAE